MRYEYHYYAIYSAPFSGVAHTNGVYIRNSPITSDNFEELRQCIKDKYREVKDLSICSITLLLILNDDGDQIYPPINPKP